MNQEQAQAEFEATRLERHSCLEWLQESEPLHSLLTAREGRNAATVLLEVPDWVKRSIFGHGTATQVVPNANEAQEQDSENIDKNNNQDEINSEPWIVRPLLGPEVHVLMTQGCRSADWSRVYLYLPQSISDQVPKTIACLQRRVSSSLFSGNVILGWPKSRLFLDNNPPLHGGYHPHQLPDSDDDNSTNPHSRCDPTAVPTGSEATAEWTLLPDGLHNGIVCNSWVQLDAKVHQNRTIRNTLIGSRAVILNVGQLTCQAAWNPHSLSFAVGPESGPGKRQLTVTPHDTMTQIGQQLKFSSTSPQQTTDEENDSNLTSSPATSLSPPTYCSYWSVVSAGALIRDTITVDSVYLHPDATIEGAACVRRCVLFSGSRIDYGSTALDCFLQWNCTIEQQSYISSVLAMEGCHLGPHSKVGDCVLGPDVALGSGEVQCSVVGPNTAAHHQSLLIGMLWLHGRGNVGYGANVGSNHTGRAPDQEAWSGEGVFWGLSNVLVYPLNLLDSPYSIVAAGTKLTPQVVSMPFSLFVNDNSNNNGCEVVPGWILNTSAYTVARCIQKWQTRRCAKRHYYYTGWPMIDRRDMLELVFQARAILRSLDQQQENIGKLWYNASGTRNDRVLGLGSCQLSEKSRQRGIHSYTDLLQRSALHGLLAWTERNMAEEDGKGLDEILDTLNQEIRSSFALVQEMQKQDGKEPQPRRSLRMPWNVTVDETWEYQKFLLTSEFFPTQEVASLTELERLLRERLVELNEQYAAAVLTSKRRDEERGLRILPNSVLGNERATDSCSTSDPVVRHVHGEIEMVRERVEAVLQCLASI